MGWEGKEEMSIDLFCKDAEYSFNKTKKLASTYIIVHIIESYFLLNLMNIS